MKADTPFLDNRLRAVAEKIRPGVTLYDIGTDHAYLPVYAVVNRRVPHAVAADIAPGPLARAEAHIEAYGLKGTVQTVLSDGLKAITPCPPCDIVMAGMGGEMMARILDEKPEIRTCDVQLILQPMTKPEVLRDYLSSVGYDIFEESVVEEGKLYEILCCRYAGIPYRLSPSERLVGRRGARQENALFYALVKKKMATLVAVMEGKRAGGIAYDGEEAVLTELKTLVHDEAEGERGCL